MFIYERKRWPKFIWDEAPVLSRLLDVRYRQGLLLGKMKEIGFELRRESCLTVMTSDVTQSSAIEGELLNHDSVRSSIASRLGIEISKTVVSDDKTEGIVSMALDSTQNFGESLTAKRLYGWHAGLFTTGYSGIDQIRVGAWRKKDAGVMKVVSGAMGKEKTHFIAPNHSKVSHEMKLFIDWSNGEANIDCILKSAIAHLWFVTIHPFEDGNGRIARAIADLFLARSDNSAERFYSMSAQIEKERKHHYNILEQTQKGGLDVSEWMFWYMNCLERAIKGSDLMLDKVLNKARIWKIVNQHTVNERQRKIINRLLDDFEGNLTTSKYAKICKCSQDTALRDIKVLINIGLLKALEGGGRSTTYALDDSL